MNIEPYLEDLENQINPEIEDQLLADCKSFCRGEWREEIFTPRRKAASAPRLTWPEVGVNQTLECFDQMMLQQMAGCSKNLAKGNGDMLAVRANYGVVILAMPFEPELFVMDEKHNCLPNCHPIGADKMREWIKKGMPSLEHPYLQRVWEMGRRFMEVKKKYPRIGKYVFPYHPDYQGPMDVLELLWGSEIFLAMVDEPETIHAALRLITDFYKAAMKRWVEIVPNWSDEFSVHWRHMQRGQLMVRDDSAMNLPPAFFEEFILPYDSELLETFGGGAIHACGRVDHYSTFFDSMRSRGLYGFNMSQPHLNNMEKVFSETVDKDIPLLSFDGKVAREAVAAGRKLRGRVSCM